MALGLRSRGCERCAIILAGGEGTRLKALTRSIAGEEVPKQFCRLMGTKTLLEQTRERTAETIAPERTLTVLTRCHERFYGPLVEGIAPHLIVEQPTGRGTAPAILYALMRLAEQAPNSVVSVFPSDHYVNNDPLFMRHIEAGARVAEERPELTVLLGIEPAGPERSYGWIEPGESLRVGETALFAVKAFVEKPGPEAARRLMDQGALWNSAVMVARASTLMSLFMIAAPGLYVAFNSVRATFDTVFESESVSRLYNDIPEANFSSDVLQKCPLNLATLPMHGVEWSDLGDPSRVMQTLARAGINPEWATA